LVENWNSLSISTLQSRITSIEREEQGFFLFLIGAVTEALFNAAVFKHCSLNPGETVACSEKPPFFF
jgi:hypothetical protein